MADLAPITRKRQIASSLTAIIGTAAMTSPLGAQPEEKTIYDMTDIIGDQRYDSGTGHAIAGAGIFGDIYDLQMCDDFELVYERVITRARNDFGCFLASDPADGALVEFFRDAEGVPEESPAWAVIAPPEDVSTEEYTDSIFGLFGLTVIADIREAGVRLRPGRWWVSITPVDLTFSGDWYYAFWDEDRRAGTSTHLRDGGLDHGTGFEGGYGVDDWTSTEDWNDQGYGTSSIALWGVGGPEQFFFEVDCCWYVGQENRFFGSGADPGERLILLWSEELGVFDPGCGEALQLVDPKVMAVTTADENGDYEFLVDIPLSANCMITFHQVFQPNGCRASNMDAPHTWRLRNTNFRYDWGFEEGTGFVIMQDGVEVGHGETRYKTSLTIGLTLSISADHDPFTSMDENDDGVVELTLDCIHNGSSCNHAAVITVDNLEGMVGDHQIPDGAAYDYAQDRHRLQWNDPHGRRHRFDYDDIVDDTIPVTINGRAYEFILSG